MTQGVKHVSPGGAYLVVGPCCWGYASSLEDATQRCLRARPSGVRVGVGDFRSYYFESGCEFEVNPIDGSVSWAPAAGGKRLKP